MGRKKHKTGNSKDDWRKEGRAKYQLGVIQKGRDRKSEKRPR